MTRRARGRDDGVDRGGRRGAGNADVAVVLVGPHPPTRAKATDRTHLGLPSSMMRFWCSGSRCEPRTVRRASNGPRLMPWKDARRDHRDVPRWQAAGAALVDVLYGDREPAGRLAETFPPAVGRCRRESLLFPGRPHQVEYREGLFVATGTTPRPASNALRLRATASATPAPRGRRRRRGRRADHGQPDRANVGKRPGSEVVSLPERPHRGGAAAPARAGRLRQGPLQPGETSNGDHRPARRAFEYYDVSTAGWQTPGGSFESRWPSPVDVVETVSCRIKGSVDTPPGPADAAVGSGTTTSLPASAGRSPGPAGPPVHPGGQPGGVGATRIGRLSSDPLALAPFGRGYPKPTRKQMKAYNARWTNSAARAAITERQAELDNGPNPAGNPSTGSRRQPQPGWRSPRRTIYAESGLDNHRDRCRIGGPHRTERRGAEAGGGATLSRSRLRGPGRRFGRGPDGRGPLLPTTPAGSTATAAARTPSGARRPETGAALPDRLPRRPELGLSHAHPRTARFLDETA